MAIQRHGFDGVYVSGAALSADLGLPDIGLTTLPEVTTRGSAIARATDLPALIDADTGFGEALNAARTIQALEDAGLCGCHLEDQVNPKRCGHLDGKSLVTTQAMAEKVRAAAGARRDKKFLIMARTDARASEGLDGAIARAKAYIDAGADAIFPEALADESEFETFRRAIKVPLLANMTEFGKSKLLTAKQLSELGFNIVIYPVTTLRLAMKAVEDGLATIKGEGTQESLVKKMQTRAELYELLRYEDYAQFDKDVFNFKL
jgi:methylisocitrate lyase